MSNIPFIILVGKSGSGKSSIAAALASKYGLKEIKTYTTRPPRFDGEDTHTFVDKNFYYESVERGDICASTVFDNNIYFTTKSQLNTYDIAIWDVEGVKYFKTKGFSERDYVVIYIDCPLKMRFKNMIKRGDSISSTIRRIKNDRIAFKDVYTNGVDLLVRNNGNKTLEDIADRIFNEISWGEYLNGLKGELFYGC